MTEKESRFARAYLSGMDAEKAAGEVGGRSGAELLEKYSGAVRDYRELLAAAVCREDIIRRLVQLGFRDGGECMELLAGGDDAVDLSLVSEIKRNSNGSMEVKLIDRVAVLKLLLELLPGEETDGAEAFLRSLQTEEGQE